MWKRKIFLIVAVGSVLLIYKFKFDKHPTGVELDDQKEERIDKFVDEAPKDNTFNNSKESVLQASPRLSETSVFKENPYGIQFQKFFDNSVTKEIIFPLNKNIEILIKGQLKGKEITKNVTSFLSFSLECLKNKSCDVDDTVLPQNRQLNRVMLQALLAYNSSYQRGYSQAPLDGQLLVQLAKSDDRRIKEVSLGLLQGDQYAIELTQKVLSSFQGADSKIFFKTVKSTDLQKEALKDLVTVDRETRFHLATAVEQNVTDKGVVEMAINLLCPYIDKTSPVDRRILKRVTRLSSNLLAEDKPCR